MIVDWDWWVLILLFLIVLILLLIYLLLRRQGAPKVPVVLFDSGRDPIDVPCGHSDTIYTNFTAGMDVNVELECVGQCAVTLSTRAMPKVLQRDGVHNKKGAAAIPLGTGDAISYACKADEDGNSRCEFRLKITRI